MIGFNLIDGLIDALHSIRVGCVSFQVCVCLSEHPFAVDLLRCRKGISTRTAFLSVFFDPVPFHFVSFMAG